MYIKIKSTQHLIDTFLNRKYITLDNNYCEFIAQKVLLALKY